MTGADPLDDILAGDAPEGAAMHAVLAALHARLPVHGDPATFDEMIALLRLLYRVARRDLPLARLFEGHVDALQIIARYANAGTAAAARGRADAGDVFGVWNAALPGEPLRLEDGVLRGAKSFASGAGIIDRALVGTDTADGYRLFLIDLAAARMEIDRDWWRVIGMQRSHTHIVRWPDMPADAFVPVGEPGDYPREPWFSGGALRFVAAHAGGIAALFDHVRDHLRATGRSGDAHQAGRLADLYLLADLAAAAVRRAAQAWFERDDAGKLAQVAAARVAVAALADRAIPLAEQAVGAAGMFRRHPLSAVIADLSVYLRQPAPDAQRMAVGRAAADAVLGPAL